MSQQATKENDALIAASIVTPAEIMRHIEVLASDEFAGRCPADVGESKTLSYFNDYFQALKEETGADIQWHQQPVPTIKIQSEARVSFALNNTQIDLVNPDQYVACSKKLVAEAKVTDSEVVFIGYGINAPEYGWNDFKNADLTGKTLFVLAGDPILRDSQDSTKIDKSLFRGAELTYYGRWTYKYETAGFRKAAAVFVIHETERAGYGWDVVTHSFGHEDFELKTSNPDERASVEGWITYGAAEELLAKAGHSLSALKESAQEVTFRPVSLGLRANATVTSSFEDVDTHNFVAILNGSNPALKNESIVYSAHWDHFGTTPAGVISGAVDNASGVAGVLALAKAFCSLPARTERSIVFFLPTLEEQNLLGSKFYVKHPLLPIEDTLAILNLEMLNPWGRSEQVSSVCKGHSSLDQLFAESAKRQNRVVVPDPQPEKGYIYRSDHVPFMQEGVPALALFFPCMSHLENRKKYIENDYHKVTDKPKADWNLDGAAEDVVLMFDVGNRLLQSGYRAKWNFMSEFNRK